MHNIHEKGGEYDIVYDIPQIIYSSVISTFINILLQKLALSEDSFITLKHEKNYEKAQSQVGKVKKCLFYILNLLFL